MDKNTIKNDMVFRRKCGNYGLSWSDFDVYEDVIILNSPKKDIFVLLDENYNTIGIHKLQYSNPMQGIEEYAIKYRDLYNHVDHNNELNLPYPFQNFSLKQIMDLANRTVFDRDIKSIIVNGKCVFDDRYDGHYNIYISLLAYIKFLANRIEQYFLDAYQMKMLGFDYPEVHSYLKSIMTNIDECINISIAEKTRPFPIDVIEYLGQNRNNIEKENTELFRVIDLLLREKGFKIVGGFEHYKDIETDSKYEINLADLSLNLLKILEVPKDEIKTESADEMSFDIEAINLQSWLEQDLCKTKNLKLTNSKKHN